MIDTKQVKELREKTGVSIMQCRKALEEAGSDMKKAEIILQKKGSSVAEKKSDRELGAGAIQAYIHSTGGVGAIVELLCETDFVAKNKEFKDLAYNLAMQITATSPVYITRDDISESDQSDAREVLKAEVADKPADLQEKILEGKIDSYFSDRILLEQSYIKDQDLTVKELVDSAVQKFGEKIKINRFTRFSI